VIYPSIAKFVIFFTTPSRLFIIGGYSSMNCQELKDVVAVYCVFVNKSKETRDEEPRQRDKPAEGAVKLFM